MGPISSHNENDLLELLNIIKRATFYDNCCIVISCSSGWGWKVNQSLEAKQCEDIWNALMFESVHSENFSTSEAEEYLKTCNIGGEKLDSIKNITGRNPLLLSYFKGSASDPDVYKNGVKKLDQLVDKQVINLLEVKDNEWLEQKLIGCDKWFSYAAHSSAIDICETTNFERSYVALENLAYISTCDNEQFYLTLTFPTLFVSFLNILKAKFHHKERGYLQSPTVQGLIFEEKVLKNMTTLNVSVKDRESSDLKNLSFHVNGATQQLTELLQVMTPNSIYHLNLGHNAIDGVCIAEDQGSKEWYLLLIQVSLSRYSSHRSKADSIGKKIDGNNDTIVNYYMKLASAAVKLADNHVVYVYASPSESDCDAVLLQMSAGVKSCSCLYGAIIPKTETWNLLTDSEKSIKCIGT